MRTILPTPARGRALENANCIGVGAFLLRDQRVETAAVRRFPGSWALGKIRHFRAEGNESQVSYIMRMCGRVSPPLRERETRFARYDEF